jgi:hypothetical protein
MAESGGFSRGEIRRIVVDLVDENGSSREERLADKPRERSA